MVTSSPSRIQVMPNAARIRPWKRDQGSRSSRAGMSVRKAASGISLPANQRGNARGRAIDPEERDPEKRAPVADTVARLLRRSRDQIKNLERHRNSKKSGGVLE